MANSLTRLGCHAAALPHSENADRTFRVVMAEYPDRYLEYVSAAAATYSNNLSHTGNPERAYAIALSNVERMSEFARRHPKRFGHEFTAHLLGLADSARDTGRYDKALRFAVEATVEARRYGRRLGQRNWYLEGVTQANLFNLYYSVLDFDGAVRASQASVRAFRRLPDHHPEALMERTRALRNLAEAQRMTGSTGSPAKALRAAQQAVAQFSATADVSTEAWRVLEAQCRTTLATCLENAGQMQEAIEEERNSLRLRRALFARSPESYRTDVAYSLQQLAQRLEASGHSEEALVAVQEAMTHYEAALPGLAEDEALAMTNALGMLVEIQATRLGAKEGVTTLTQGLRWLMPRYERAPERWLPTLLPLCVRYVLLSEAAGVPADYSLVENVIAHAQREAASG